jgi:nucleoside phosphorylase
MNGIIDREEGIIRPRKGKDDPDAGPDVLMVMVRFDIQYLLTRNEKDEIESHDMGPFKLYRIKSGPDSVLTMAGPFLGAPQAVLGMERLIALGAKRIWGYGWCGSLSPDLRIGDLLIPTAGISEEGTSRHYPIGERAMTTDPGLRDHLIQALSRRGEPYRQGPVWTTDAPYRETPSKVKAFGEQGVLAVEMEMSALMTLALYRNVRFAALLVVSDELFELKWRPGFRDPGLKKRMESAGDLLFDHIAKGEW